MVEENEQTTPVAKEPLPKHAKHAKVASPGGANPGDTSPDGASPGDAASSGASPDGASPGDAASSGATPSDASPDGASPGGSKKKVQVRILAVILTVLIVAIVCLSAFLGYQWWKMTDTANRAADVPEEVEKPVDETQLVLPENPVDFDALKAENPDIYAWITIPGTEVNYPVVQSPTDDFYYLNHDVDFSYAWQGSIYSEMQNSTNFSDPVTVLYGHQTDANTMFTSLHYFEDPDFFAEHETITVYSVGHVRTYRVISAYQFDDRHILNSFDFSNPEVLADYYDYVCNPNSLVMNVREGAHLEVTDKIIQLSTCLSLTDSSNKRYIVTGVLVDDQLVRQ